MFKRCPNCGVQWLDRDAFLADPGIEAVGYQVNFEELAAGIFLFNHACLGTLAIEARNFRDLYAGPIFAERATGRTSCPRYCLNEDNLQPCPAKCECAFVRRILQIVQNWPKTGDMPALRSA